MNTDKRRHKVRLLSTLMATGLGLMAWLFGGSSIAQAATSANVGLGAHILNPPNAISDLAASAVGSNDGDIRLSWSAPSNDNKIAISHYYVRYATFAAASPAVAETWWTNASGTQQTISPAFAPGTLEFKTLTGFTLGTTYYFGIKAVDNDGMVAPIDTRVGLSSQAASLPLDTGLNSAPNTPSNFVGVALSSTSIQWTWNNTVGANYYLFERFPTEAFKSTQTASTVIIETDLTPNSANARTLRAGNAFGLSNPTPAKTVYTKAVLPENLKSTQVGFTSVKIAWTDAGNPSGTQYRVERSLDNFNFVVLKLTTDLDYTDSQLSEQTSYYYRLLSINGDGVATGPTETLTVFTKKKFDFLKPKAPMGLKGARDTTGRVFTLAWEAVKQNEDNTTIDDLVGYRIYRRNKLDLGLTPELLTPTELDVTAYADQIDGEIYYYTITAVDTSGNESDASLIADSSVNANVIFFDQSGNVSVVIPSSISDLLTSGNNKLGVPITINVEEKPVTDTSTTFLIRHIDLQWIRGDTGNAITDLAFPTAQSVVGVGYSVVNGQVGIGSPSAANAVSAQATSAQPTDLSLYWYNGVTWVKVGGTVDFSAQALKTKSSFLGNYQLRISAQSTSLNLEQANVFPRLFTPNNDGHNDQVYFVLENPNDAEVTGEIFDMEGRAVRTLPAPASNTGIGTTLIWDGRDDSGQIVSGGVYLYRIRGEGKTFTGTVAVAR